MDPRPLNFVLPKYQSRSYSHTIHRWSMRKHRAVKDIRRGRLSKRHLPDAFASRSSRDTAVMGFPNRGRPFIIFVPLKAPGDYVQGG